MGKDEKNLTLKQRFKKATGDRSRIFIYMEEVSGKNGGTKEWFALRVEKTAVNLCDRKTLKEELEKHKLHLHESEKSSPFMHVCDGTEMGGE